MTETTRRITYRGSPALAGLLAQMLAEEGVQVRLPRRGDETRSLQEMAQDVTTQLIAARGILAIKAAVDRFRRRFPNTKIDIEGDEDDD